MTKWIVTTTTVIDNEEPDDKAVESAQDAIEHTKRIIQGRVSTANRVQIDIDETILQHNRYSGTLNNWYPVTRLSTG